MSEVKFSVAAKAARLIGRENIADVDGALIELIKNAYDADATCVLVKMSIPFPDVPSKISIAAMAEILESYDLAQIAHYYDEQDHQFIRKSNLTEQEQQDLEDMLFAYNEIIIADNGCGMTEKIVGTTWMNIGTSDKENNVVSQKGRVKTGAKGIGRFALDKLSKNSVMYTKSSESDAVIQWVMNWEQFAEAELIDDVKANVEKKEQSYELFVSEEFKNNQEVLAQHDWTTGTMICLSPTREKWSKRLFQKVNTNLNSINPIGSVDRFEVRIENEYFSDYNYRTEEVAIDRDSYDYRIKVHYDGDDLLVVRLLRNEVDLTKEQLTFEKYGQSVTKNVEEFWQRERLQIDNYRKENYEQEIVKILKVQDVLKEDEPTRIKSVGAFEAEMYFLRNMSSPGYDIMKKVVAKKRRDLLQHFSGIKIYRDDFKVRPYGDEGALYDWLALGSRAQKSPAPPAHPHGRWRVEPYQMIGWVKIGRETNPELEDMANREGIALTDAYYILVNMLQVAIDEFEYDRQYIYREYAQWKDSIEKSLADYAERAKEEAKRREQKKARRSDKADADGASSEDTEAPESDQQAEEEGSEFTEDELFGTIQRLVDEAERELQSKQMLQILSSSGVVLNTFFHEFNAINTQFHIQAAQIRSRVNYILGGKEYTGIPAYNPYTRIDILEKNDKLTAAFLDVVMDGLKKHNLVKNKISLRKEMMRILNKWQLLLESRHIQIKTDFSEDNAINDSLVMAVVDVYIILNNFLLNSAWFLEQAHNSNREIEFRLYEQDGNLCLVMENNGPSLDEKYANNPDKIFEMGETSKDQVGTGLGLWVVKETVERNKGDIKVLDKEDGFGLQIVFKGVIDDV